jgi:LPS O-antigen subunit length determinant protein (WzzB/FepE family)
VSTTTILREVSNGRREVTQVVENAAGERLAGRHAPNLAAARRGVETWRVLQIPEEPDAPRTLTLVAVAFLLGVVAALAVLAATTSWPV